MSWRYLFLVALMVCASAKRIQAHAFLEHAEPGVGSQVHEALALVKIWFSERLEPALSKIQVFDATGQEVDKHDTKIDQSNPAILSVSVPGLKPGEYHVIWRVVSVDTHVTTGKYNFTVVL